MELRPHRLGLDESMLWIGLTGGIATGKSTAAQILRQMGYTVVDADGLAHAAILPKQPPYKLVVDHFGTEILNSDGLIDRPRLGKIVFADPAKRLILESFIHPWIQQEVQHAMEHCRKKNDPLAFYDVPLLFEKKLQAQFDSTLVIYAPRAVQLSRMQKRDGLSLADCEKRLASQIDIEAKRKLATATIENIQTLEKLQQNLNEFVTFKLKTHVKT